MCSRLDLGYILLFENLSDDHSCMIYNEYEFKNLLLFGAYPTNQKEAKLSLTLKPLRNQILIFRQLGGKIFSIQGGDFQCQFSKVKF